MPIIACGLLLPPGGGIGLSGMPGIAIEKALMKAERLSMSSTSLARTVEAASAGGAEGEGVAGTPPAGSKVPAGAEGWVRFITNLLRTVPSTKEEIGMDWQDLPIGRGG
jgi:hypothetical protein